MTRMPFQVGKYGLTSENLVIYHIKVRKKAYNHLNRYDVVKFRHL